MWEEGIWEWEYGEQEYGNGSVRSRSMGMGVRGTGVWEWECEEWEYGNGSVGMKVWVGMGVWE